MSNHKVIHSDPAPFLSALHAAQAKEGFLSRSALEELAASLKIPLAELYSSASFYHYLRLDGKKPLLKGVCRGPVCSLPGIAQGRGESTPSISCPGLCDQAPAHFDDGKFLSENPEGPFLLPGIVGTEEAVFQNIRMPNRRFESYRRNGGYQGLVKLVRENGAGGALETLEASGLRGRGGAGFPLVRKWKAVREAKETPKFVICNADEGEPGTFKDRAILHLHPHLLLEAMAIAGYLVGAEEGIIYLRFEYPHALEVLERAANEAEEGGLLGKNIAGADFSFSIRVKRGAGSYVCGEESALLNSLEGRRPWPRERPPYPTSSGLWGVPTVVNNVETLCFVPLILQRGASWFRSLGRGKGVGTKIYSVSGKVKRPGNYELPLGSTAREIICDAAGGPPVGREIKGFTLGGISGGLLSRGDLDLALDCDSSQKEGVFLGSGGVIVLDDSCCVVEFVRTCLLFYESESCGKCYPCRIGTVRLRELLDGVTGRRDLTQEAERRIREIGTAMEMTSACGLGQSAPLVLKGMARHFADEVAEHLKDRKCRAGLCAL